MGRKASINSEEILNTAEDIIIQEGAAHLTIGKIAKKLGITKGGVQYSFASKDAIVEAIIKRWNDDFDAEMQNHMPPNPTPLEFMRAHIVTTHYIDNYNKKAAGLMLAMLDSHKYRDLARQWYHERIKVFAETKSAEYRKYRLAFLACEGIFMLNNFGLKDADLTEWDDIFTDIEQMLLNGKN